MRKHSYLFVSLLVFVYSQSLASTDLALEEETPCLGEVCLGQDSSRINVGWLTPEETWKFLADSDQTASALKSLKDKSLMAIYRRMLTKETVGLTNKDVDSIMSHLGIIGIIGMGEFLSIDSEALKILSARKPVFCEAMLFSMFFRSKGGRLTQVSLASNTDRTLRVVRIDRWYWDLNEREIEDLRGKLEKEYEQQLKLLEVKDSCRMGRYTLRASLLHPIHIGKDTQHFLEEMTAVLLENPECKVSTRID